MFNSAVFFFVVYVSRNVNINFLSIELLYKSTHIHSQTVCFLVRFPLRNRKVLIYTLVLQYPLHSSPSLVLTIWHFLALIHPLSILVCAPLWSVLSFLFCTFPECHEQAFSPSLNISWPQRTCFTPHSLSIHVAEDRISTAQVACLNLYLAPKAVRHTLPKQNQTARLSLFAENEFLI